MEKTNNAAVIGARRIDILCSRGANVFRTRITIERDKPSPTAASPSPGPCQAAAASHYETAVQCNGDDLMFRFDAGRLANLQGRYTEARRHLEIVTANASGELASLAQDLLTSKQ